MQSICDSSDTFRICGDFIRGRKTAFTTLLHFLTAPIAGNASFLATFLHGLARDFKWFLNLILILLVVGVVLGMGALMFGVYGSRRVRRGGEGKGYSGDEDGDGGGRGGGGGRGCVDVELELEVLGGEDFDDDDEGCMSGYAGGIETGVEACKGVVISLAQDTPPLQRIYTISTPLSTRHSAQLQQCCFDAESSPKPRPASEWTKTRDYFLR